MISDRISTTHLSVENIPDAMLDMTSELRHKAIETANSLIDQGYQAPVAISMASERVRNWAGLPHSTLAHHVIPHPDGWAVMKADADKPSLVTGTKKDALDQGRTIARNQNGKLVIHGQDGMVQTEHSYEDG